MRLDKLALTAQESLQQAIIIASEAESSTVEPIHLLKALLTAGENNLTAIIKRIGADPAQLGANVDAELEKVSKVSGQMQVMPSQSLMQMLDSSVKIAEKLGDSYATSEHLL
ncbi:MAG: Clp protease N-terminal domain-containing protein, partial [Raoultibacter sp.]